MREKRQQKATGPVRGIVRQGDVLLVPVDDFPAGDGVSVEDGARFVLAEGEATGHAHVVHGQSKLVRSPRTRRGEEEIHLLVDEIATLVHDEHDPIPLATGAYQVVRQREYAPRPRARAQFSWVAD